MRGQIIQGDALQELTKKHVLSYGGGVNSTALYFLIRENNLPLDEVIFADTGCELPETYEIVKRMASIAKKDNVLFSIVKSSLAMTLYDYYWDNKAIPSIMRRDCTAKFKIRPIRKYLRSKYGKTTCFVNYIGIALEEAHRMRTSDVKYSQNQYPLVEFRIDREGCFRILKEQGFSEVAKSGCYICPFMGKQGWAELLDKHPELMEKAIKLEENCPNKKMRFNRIPLRQFRDDKRFQTKLEDYEPSCDVAGGCFL